MTQKKQSNQAENSGRGIVPTKKNRAAKTQDTAWVAGTVVATASGEAMTVTGNQRASIDCSDSQGMPHVFSVAGKALCSRFQGYDCAHGDLIPTYTAPVTPEDAQELSEPTVVTALPFRHDTMNACTCGEGDLPGLAHCEGCALYIPVSATVEDERRIEAAREAEAFNARVWNSADMRECRQRLSDATADISDAMYGWGTLTLDNARAHLTRAIALIDAMKAMKGDN